MNLNLDELDEDAIEEALALSREGDAMAAAAELPKPGEPRLFPEMDLTEEPSGRVFPEIDLTEEGPAAVGIARKPLAPRAPVELTPQDGADAEVESALQRAMASDQLRGSAQAAERIGRNFTGALLGAQPRPLSTPAPNSAAQLRAALAEKAKQDLARAALVPKEKQAEARAKTADTYAAQVEMGAELGPKKLALAQEAEARKAAADAAANEDRDAARQQRAELAAAKAKPKTGEKPGGLDEKAIRELAKRVGTSVAEIMPSLDTVDRYLKAADVPGIGQLDVKPPAWMQSDEALEVQNAAGNVVAIMLQARSGQTVSDKELERAEKRFGIGGNDERAFRLGMKRLRIELARVLRAKAAGFAPEVKAEFRKRGGLTEEDLTPPPAAPQEGMTRVVLQDGRPATISTRSAELLIKAGKAKAAP